MHIAGTAHWALHAGTIAAGIFVATKNWLWVLRKLHGWKLTYCSNFNTKINIHAIWVPACRARWALSSDIQFKHCSDSLHSCSVIFHCCSLFSLSPAAVLSSHSLLLLFSPLTLSCCCSLSSLLLSLRPAGQTRFRPHTPHCLVGIWPLNFLFL